MKFENVSIRGWEHAVACMRHSESASDSIVDLDGTYRIGMNDFTLMKILIDKGDGPSRYRKMIHVDVDITATLYWWQEFEMYHVGDIMRPYKSTELTHLANKKFVLEDFTTGSVLQSSENSVKLVSVIMLLNDLRAKYRSSESDVYLEAIAQMLPSSYNDTRSLIDVSYEELATVYSMRKTREHDSTEWMSFFNWVGNLPYSDLITRR